MRIRLLGTAAGGGVPQWNCNCAVCREARAGSGRVEPRTQSCVAISADDRRWFLLNASPDLRGQIEAFPPLHPFSDRVRISPIEGVLVTNADLDHTLGLLLLREGEKLPVHATHQTRRSLTEGLLLGPVLESFCGLDWIEPPHELSPLQLRDGSPSGLRYQAIEVGGKPPRFAKDLPTSSGGIVIGFRILDERTGGRLVFLPDVAGLNDALLAQISDCDVLLFDGTFWSETEMSERGVGVATAASMGHVPISGASGSFALLAGVKAAKKIYIHINNTNPILLQDSTERQRVEAAGWTIGRDGMEFVV
jgi:pyrroloquinoline quinone biosynthesis protein B